MRLTISVRTDAVKATQFNPQREAILKIAGNSSGGPVVRLSVQRVRSLVRELRLQATQCGWKKKKETNQIGPVHVINEQSMYLINLQLLLLKTLKHVLMNMGFSISQSFSWL